MILYHGSNCDIESIDLSMCNPVRGQMYDS